MKNLFRAWIKVFEKEKEERFKETKFDL